jgi:hypothetical protein
MLKLLQRRTTKIATVAMATKMARGGAYREPVPQAV